MKISIIIPVFNERKTILSVISKIDQVFVEKEIIIVDDFSSDGTVDLLREFQVRKGVKVFYHDRNYGKGFAIRSGLKEVTGDIVVIQDADLEYSPEDLPHLIEPILQGQTKIVFGNRYHSENNMFFSKYKIAVVLLTKLANFLYGIKISDEATCYKIFHKEVFEKITLKCRRFEFCPEVIAKAAKAGYKIVELPIKYNPRSREEGKKIGLFDGFQAFYTLCKYRFSD